MDIKDIKAAAEKLGFVVIPKTPDFLPGESNFDEELFNLCRYDDYKGLYLAFIKRAK